jgi:Flp pilus assembly protein TadG
VAVTFALALIPITLAVGAAVDYSFANKAKAQFDAAADTAVLAAVNKAAMAGTATAAQKTALNMFNAYAVTVQRASLGQVTATVTDGNGSRSAVVSYKATVPTAFMGLIGINNMTIAGSSTAASGLLTYIDFYLLLDNTPSMGIGATQADINKLVANTPDKCAFACHDLSASPNDYYGLAKKTWRPDAHRRDAPGDTTADGHGQLNAGRVRPIPDGDLYLRFFRQECRTDDDSAAHVEFINGQVGCFGDRSNDCAVSELRLRHRHRSS